MTPEAAGIQARPPRVSILARIVPALSYALPALGAALSAYLFINVIWAMREAEAAGIAAVAGGMSEANLAIVVSLYLAIFVGFIGLVIGFVRCLSTIRTASPAGWLFLIMGILGLAPVLTLWQAESFLISVLVGSGGGISEVARYIVALLFLTLGLAVVACLILLIISVIPLPAALRARQKWSPVVFLLLMELVTIGMTIAYHMRTYWFYQVRLNERF